MFGHNQILLLPWTHVSLGAGGTFRNRFFKFTFPGEVKDRVTDINHLDAIAIIMALKLWGPCLKGLRFIMKCDNQTTVAVINAGRAHEPFLQACARDIIFWHANIYLILIKFISLDV